MAKTFLLFDFGTDEEAAQKARHRLEAWKQAFRLGNKISFKFERLGSEPQDDFDGSSDKEATGKHGPATRKSKADLETAEQICLLIRLDFSNHEKHLSQTWLQRIPGEEPFKSATPQEIQSNAADFEKVSEHFDSLK